MYESIFGTQRAKCNVLGLSVDLSGAMAALVMLANYDADSSQRISILAAAAPNDKSFIIRLTTNDFIDTVSYGKISSIIYQYENPTTRARKPHKFTIYFTQES